MMSTVASCRNSAERREVVSATASLRLEGGKRTQQRVVRIQRQHRREEYLRRFLEEQTTLRRIGDVVEGNRVGVAVMGA
jgi:hypothetical protein